MVFKMRINVHAHGSHAERNKDGKLVLPLMLAWRPEHCSPAQFIKQHHSLGVEKLFLLDSPEIAFEYKRIFGDFIIPIPGVDMDKCVPADIEALFTRGARGIKFIGPLHSYGDSRYFPLYDVIRKHRGLAMFHTGFLAVEIFNPGGLHARNDYLDITHMRPAAIDRVARAFPDLKILMAHFGNPWWEETWTVLKSHKNVYAELSGGTAKTRSMVMWQRIFAPGGKLHAESASKLCFGTDGSSFAPDHYKDLKRMTDFYERLYEALRLPEEIRRKIDRENAIVLADTGA